MRKMPFNFLILLCLLFLLSSAYAGNDLLKRARAVFKPIPKMAPIVKKTPAVQEKIKLGRALYFDPRLSKSGLISCNTCHNVGMGGADFQETSIGHGWKKGQRNAPTVFNAVFNIAQFWDGRAPNLKEQAKGPIQAAVEMNNTPEHIMETVKSMPAYTAMFKSAFPNEMVPLTFDNLAMAIEVFEATLITPDSQFDKYLQGDETALTIEEKEGLELFMNKGCSACHSGTNMGGTGYFPFGVAEKPKEEITAGDLGRFKLTGAASDQNVFKSPSLRNIALTPPYFHSGKVWRLTSAVAIMGSSQLGITLTKEETEKIVQFLKTTTGIQPVVVYPLLPAPTEKTPKPAID